MVAKKETSAEKEKMKKQLKKIPVKDIKVTKAMTVDDMLQAMGRAGGFTAQKLADATDIAEKMVKKEGCLKIPPSPPASWPPVPAAS